MADDETSAKPNSKDQDNHKYDGDTSARYAREAWVSEVADNVVSILQHERAFNSDDIVLDFGCGPGVTLERIFERNGGKSK